MHHWWWLLLALLTGCVIPFQAIVNGRLGVSLQNPFLAAFVSFATGTFAVVVVLLIATPGWPTWPREISLPWYLFIGGTLGAIYVTVVLSLVPLIGAADLLAATIVGQLIMGLIIDHFALLGVPQYSVSPTRILGCLLLIGGLLLIQMKT